MLTRAFLNAVERRAPIITAGGGVYEWRGEYFAESRQLRVARGKSRVDISPASNGEKARCPVA